MQFTNIGVQCHLDWSMISGKYSTVAEGTVQSLQQNLTFLQLKAKWAFAPDHRLILESIRHSYLGIWIKFLYDTLTSVSQSWSEWLYWIQSIFEPVLTLITD